MFTRSARFLKITETVRWESRPQKALLIQNIVQQAIHSISKLCNRHTGYCPYQAQLVPGRRAVSERALKMTSCNITLFYSFLDSSKRTCLDVLGKGYYQANLGSEAHSETAFGTWFVPLWTGPMTDRAKHAYWRALYFSPQIWINHWFEINHLCEFGPLFFH